MSWGRGRGGAVTVNYVADARPLRRGVQAANKYVRQLGRGANLNAVARDVSKVSGRMGGLVSGVSHLRMGWFGAGAAATAALGGMAAGISRIGNEYDQAVVSIERATGASISQVEGLEAAFRDAVAAGPESMAETAAVFGAVVTDLTNDVTAAGGQMTAELAAQAGELTEQYQQLGRAIGTDNVGQIQSFVSGATVGLVAESEAIDMLAWAGQTFPGLDPAQLAKQTQKQRGLFGDDIPASQQIGIAAALYHATGDLRNGMSLLREMAGRMGDQGVTGAQAFERLQSDVDAAMREAGADRSAQVAAVTGVLAAPEGRGGYALTTGVQGLAQALVGDDTIRLRFDQAGLNEMVASSLGARYRGNALTVDESWQALFRELEVELGPATREFLRTVLRYTSDNVDVISEFGFTGSQGWIASVAQEFGAQLTEVGYMPIRWAAEQAPDWVPGVDLLRDIEVPNPKTSFEATYAMRLADDAIAEMTRRGELDLGKISATAREQITWVARNLVGNDYYRGQAFYAEQGDQAAQADYARMYIHDFIMPMYREALGEQLRVDAEIREQTALMEAEIGQTAAVEAGSRFRDLVAQGGDIHKAAVAYGAEVQAALASKLAWIAADIGSLLGDASPGRVDFTGILSEGSLLDRIGWDNPLADLTTAAGRAANALYELNDGVMELADGVIFRQHEIVSQSTDADGFTTSFISGGGVTTSGSVRTGDGSPSAASPPAVAQQTAASPRWPGGVV